MARIKETTVYTFDELSDSAKEKAREWYRERQLDYEWWGSVYDDFERICEILGVELARRRGGKDLAVYFSGFWTQGSGASFEGQYYPRENAGAKIREYAPLDAKLHSIADALDDLQARNGNSLSATIREDRLNLQVSVCSDRDNENARVTDDRETGIADAMRELAQWLYCALEKDYKYLTSDETVDGDIMANEYEFYEDGHLA